MDQQTLAANGIVAAPSWSLLLGHVGAGCVLAGAVFFVLAVLGAAFKSPAARWLFVLGSVCILGAMASLATLFLSDQFQFEYVANHSWKDLAGYYKFAAVWSGQQGSFLLWATTSAIFGLLALRGTGQYQRWFLIAYSVFLATLCGILAYETPFGLLSQWAQGGVQYRPPDGLGLNPSLQNYWVVIHPPTIFTGFGSLTVPFAYAVAAMMTRDATEWLRRVRPWALLSLAILGLGLVMGGLWAYETQGWGGFWAWDPVENVSFVPWIFMAAFIHGLIVQSTRKRWHGTNLLMGGLPFLLFAYGTFLTRSGFLSKFSVHSFAEMNRSALWILMTFLVLVSAGFVTLWAIRGTKLGKELDAEQRDEGFNREKAYQAGVIFLTGLATTIAIGMSVPFFVGIVGGSGKVVDEPLYHNVVVWFFMPIAALMGAAPFLAWRRMSASDFWSRLINVLGITLGIVGVVMIVLKFSDLPRHSADSGGIVFPLGIIAPRFTWVMCLFSLTAFAAVANIARFIEIVPRSKLGVGSFLAHLGVATALSGLILSRGLEQKSDVFFVMEGVPHETLGYKIAYKGMTSNPDKDRNNKVEFTIDTGSETFLARPGFFFTEGEGGEAQGFTWPHIQRALTHDFYLSLAEPQYTLWKPAPSFKKGETKSEVGVSVTYLEPTQHGKPAQAGTAFGAKIKVVEGGKEYFSEPQIKIGSGPSLVRASPSFYAYLEGMDPADRSVKLQLAYVHPLYPMQIFYKPLTLLVWIGTGILTLGGLLSAFYRRYRRPTPDGEDAVSVTVETDKDALVTTP